jgi:hypothetical protein
MDEDPLIYQDKLEHELKDAQDDTQSVHNMTFVKEKVEPMLQDPK